MNRKELIENIALQTDIPKGDAEAALKAIIDIITKQLSEGEEVSLVGFGVFGVRERAEKEGRNPQTGESITIKAARVPYFKAGKTLKDSCNA